MASCSSTSAAGGLVGAGAAFSGATFWVVASSAASPATASFGLAFASPTSDVDGATNPLRSQHATCGRATLLDSVPGMAPVLQVSKAEDLSSTELYPAQQKGLP